MKRNLPYNLLLVFLILFTGCKQKGKETISSVTEEAVYQPASPKYTAKYDKPMSNRLFPLPPLSC